MPLLFIIVDQLVQTTDTDGKGDKVGEILEVCLLGYVGDSSMIDEDSVSMISRLTKFTNVYQIY